MAQHIETHVPPVDTAKIEAAVRMILEAIGEDPQREGLIDTPRRVAAAYAELCAGMRDDVQRHLQVHFQEDHDELVLVRDIPFFSLCEHHLLPFFGKAHIAYIPRDGRVTGLSKLAAGGGGLCPAPADAGADDRADRGHPDGTPKAAGRGGGHRSGALVHEHAGHSETGREDGDLRGARALPHRREDPGRGLALIRGHGIAV